MSTVTVKKDCTYCVQLWDRFTGKLILQSNVLWHGFMNSYASLKFDRLYMGLSCWPTEVHSNQEHLWHTVKQLRFYWMVWTKIFHRHCCDQTFTYACNDFFKLLIFQGRAIVQHASLIIFLKKRRLGCISLNFEYFGFSLLQTRSKLSMYLNTYIHLNLLRTKGKSKEGLRRRTVDIQVRKVLEWTKQDNTKLMTRPKLWPQQYWYFWTVLKSRVYARKPTNLNNFFQFYLEWWRIQPELWMKELVDHYQNHLVKVQLATGHLLEQVYFRQYVDYRCTMH